MVFQIDSKAEISEPDEIDPRVVDAARKLLTSDAGLDFTADQLATALGLSRATLYRRIGSRDSLMRHLAKTENRVAAGLCGPDMRRAGLLAARRCCARGGMGHVTAFLCA